MIDPFELQKDICKLEYKMYMFEKGVYSKIAPSDRWDLYKKHLEPLICTFLNKYEEKCKYQLAYMEFIQKKVESLSEEDDE